MIEQLSQAVRDRLTEPASLEELVEILREYKARGVSQAQARDALEVLRASADEQTEDRILEMLDTVTGFCAPRLRVWERDG